MGLRVSVLASPLADLARAVAANWDMVRDPDCWAPMTIGRYHLDFELGRGAFGVVFSGFDPAIERDVAIKVFYAPDSSSDHARREARMLAGLCHPNIVTLHDYDREGELEYLVFELVDGDNLGECMRDLDWRETLALFIDAGRGLAAVHRAGLVHSDVKPSNILVSNDHHALLADFGSAFDLARRRTDERRPGGTHAYMAPEYFVNWSIDARADQFAFCMSVWEGLFGIRPWAEHEFEFEGVYSGVHEPNKLDTPTDLPGSVEQALRRGLSSKPGERFGTIDDLLQALIPAATGTIFDLQRNGSTHREGLRDGPSLNHTATGQASDLVGALPQRPMVPRHSGAR